MTYVHKWPCFRFPLSETPHLAQKTSIASFNESYVAFQGGRPSKMCSSGESLVCSMLVAVFQCLAKKQNSKTKKRITSVSVQSLTTSRSVMTTCTIPSHPSIT